jgi:hypothetical protein
MPGYIYLIRMADGVFKVGRTQQEYGTHLKRLKAYPKDSTMIYIRKTDDECESERCIIAMFVQKFGHHPRGFEYFTGDEKEMVRIIESVLDPQIPLCWWDGQPVHVRDMIRAIHAYTQRRHFKYEDLLKALEARGFRVDPVTWLVSQTNVGP